MTRIHGQNDSWAHEICVLPVEVDDSNVHIVAMTSSPAADTAPRQQESKRDLVVIDERGTVFNALRDLDLGIAIWRTFKPPTDLSRLTEGTILVFAAYGEPGEPEWQTVSTCARSCVTIVATFEANAPDAVRAIRAGAFGYIDFAMPPEGLRRTILGLERGEPAYRREAIGQWLREARLPRTAIGAPSARLTSRQREILVLISRGATDKEIGARLGIRTATAQKHVANLLRRLSVPNRAAAVGLLFTDEDRPRPAPDRR